MFMFTLLSKHVEYPRNSYYVFCLFRLTLKIEREEKTKHEVLQGATTRLLNKRVSVYYLLYTVI